MATRATKLGLQETMSAAYIGRLSLTHANAGDLALHRAIAQNDLDAVRRLLDNDATLVCAGGATPRSI